MGPVVYRVRLVLTVTARVMKIVGLGRVARVRKWKSVDIGIEERTSPLHVSASTERRRVPRVLHFRTWVSGWHFVS